MRSGYTHIAVVLDESGSMASLKRATIESLNKFVEEQRQVEGEATLTLIKFNDVVQPICHFQNLNSPLVTLTEDNYQPNKTTALYDAEGWTIEYTGKRLAEMLEDERPEKVIVVIVTDGLENASTDFSREQIEALIKHQEETYKWQFVFLASNQSATMSAQSMGMHTNSAMTYAPTPQGVGMAYAALSAELTKSRRSGPGGQSISFSTEDRLLQKSLGAHDDDLNSGGFNAPPVATPNRRSSSSQGWPTKGKTS